MLIWVCGLISKKEGEPEELTHLTEGSFEDTKYCRQFSFILYKKVSLTACLDHFPFNFLSGELTAFL